jgi:uncharacterized LabA/DUF88 family protein
MSVVKHSNQRVAVFIDTQNMYHSARNIYHARVNFGNLLTDAVAGRQLIRARAYVVTTESNEEKSFFEALTKLGIEIRTKDLQIFFGGAKKADWDVGLAIDAVTAAPKVDTIVLATGDGDFIPLVEYLRVHSGCQVEVISFGKSSSSKLKEACDAFTDMDTDPERYLINYRAPRGSVRTAPEKPTPVRSNTPETDTVTTPTSKPEVRSVSVTPKSIPQPAFKREESQRPQSTAKSAPKRGRAPKRMQQRIVDNLGELPPIDTSL